MHEPVEWDKILSNWSKSCWCAFILIRSFAGAATNGSSNIICVSRELHCLKLDANAQYPLSDMKCKFSVKEIV